MTRLEPCSLPRTAASRAARFSSPLRTTVLCACLAAATLTAEAIFYGVRCGVIHPGFTDTPMVRALGEEMIKEKILPNTQLRRLITPLEIADAICFMISNSAVSGQLWADAGWHPMP